MNELGIVCERIAELPRPLLIALDVDGTLAPIVEDPARARIPRGVLASLHRISQRDDVLVALASGRDAAQLDAMEGSRFFRVVEHGRGIVRPGERELQTPLEASERERLARFRAWALTEAVPAGARLEEKRASLVVHVRGLAKRDRKSASALLERAVAAAQQAELVPREGRAALEAELDHADKASAVLELMTSVGAPSLVYAGDDRTDETAIALAARMGIGLFVRSTEHEAPPDSVLVDGPSAIAELLRRLAERL
jgi:trehalose-phosphatase